MDPQAALNPKQQVVERVRQAQNVLVTVSTNPTVDQLAACIGFTLMLNKLEKHATAVFSGQVPSTIEFLRPEETLEKNTNSLRDFIISLDKSKADKLRYKVEENVVKIFITPYRTSLSEKDLDFSQGDFNVDVVVALGVTQREQLDQAIVSHGRILHDATVISISAGQAASDIGAINWQEPAASSLCEMLVSISEAFQGGLLDGQIATAFLTGIVAETERFSNPKTSPKVMTMAAQLMAAGANQQLIATELQPVLRSNPTANPGPQTGGGPAGAAPATNADGSLTIPHVPPPELTVAIPPEEPKPSEAPEVIKDGIHIDEHGTLRTAEEVRLAQDNKREHKVIEPLGEPGKTKTELSKLLAQEPGFGGTFNANTDNPDDKPEPTTDALSLPPVDNGTYGLPSDTSTPPPGMPMPTPPEPPQPPQPPQPPTPPMPPPPLMPMSPPPMPPSTPTPPPLPPVKDDETLVEIERDVHSPHLEQLGNAAAGTNPDGTVNAARDAVKNAINSIPFDSNRPDPIQALNAAPMDLPLPGSPLQQPFQSREGAVTNPFDTSGPTDSSGSSRGLLPMQPPNVPQENGAPVDPLNGTLHAGEEESSSAFDPTAPITPPDPQDLRPPGSPEPPPPVPPPMIGFPIPPEDKH